MGTYRTSDLYYAAYLRVAGVPFLGTERAGKRVVFLFEDIAKIDDRSLQVVLREVSPQDLAMSLKGVSEEVHEKVLGNLSRRAAQMLEEELELMGRVRRSSVEEAQGKIVAVIRRLEDKGDIEIDVGGVDDFVA